MKNNKKDKNYHIECSRFEGNNSSTGWSGYCYKLWFNKSLQHTGTFHGIEKGLDMYRRYENSTGLIRWLIKKFMGYKF